MIYKTYPKIGEGVEVTHEDHPNSRFVIESISGREVRCTRLDRPRSKSDWFYLHRLKRVDGQEIMPNFYVDSDLVNIPEEDEDQDAE